jgi:hypothetical protein
VVECLSLRQPYVELEVQGRQEDRVQISEGNSLSMPLKLLTKKASILLNIDCNKLAKGAVIMLHVFMTSRNILAR